MVFSGLVMLWRLAGWPTRTWPSSVKATIDGVVRPPSAFSSTLALFPSITATQEFVVPRSIPIAFAMTRLLVFRCVRVAFERPALAEWNWASLQNFPGHVRDAHSASGGNGERVPQPPGVQAACLAWPSLASASLTSIFFGSGFAGFGITILRTPFDIVA